MFTARHQDHRTERALDCKLGTIQYSCIAGRAAYTHQIQNHESPHIHEVSAKDPDQYGHTRVTHLRPHNPLLVHRASAHMAPWSSTSRTPSTRRRPAWQHTRLAAAANTRQATATQAACWSLHSYFSHGLSHDGAANCSAFASCL